MWGQLLFSFINEEHFLCGKYKMLTLAGRRRVIVEITSSPLKTTKKDHKNRKLKIRLSGRKTTSINYFEVNLKL